MNSMTPLAVTMLVRCKMWHNAFSGVCGVQADIILRSGEVMVHSTNPVLQ